jgi:hypothetical protein
MVVGTLSSEDKSVLVRGDGNGEGGTEQVGWWSRRVIGEANSSVVSVCSSRLLALRVRSGVGVDGCRDRIGSVEEHCLVSKKKWKAACLAAYTSLEWFLRTGSKYLRCT